MPASDFTVLPDLEATRRNRTLFTTRLMRHDRRELQAIAAKRDDGTSVETLLAAIVHEGTRKLVESEA